MQKTSEKIPHFVAAEENPWNRKQHPNYRQKKQNLLINLKIICSLKVYNITPVYNAFIAPVSQFSKRYTEKVVERLKSHFAPRKNNCTVIIGTAA